LKVDFVCFSYEGNAEDISVLETYVFSIPAYDEEVVSNIDQENQFLMNIPAKMMKSRVFS
jgi:hypothetical protein